MNNYETNELRAKQEMLEECAHDTCNPQSECEYKDDRLNKTIPTFCAQIGAALEACISDLYAARGCILGTGNEPDPAEMHVDCLRESLADLLDKALCARYIARDIRFQFGE